METKYRPANLAYLLVNLMLFLLLAGVVVGVISFATGIAGAEQSVPIRAEVPQRNVQLPSGYKVVHPSQVTLEIQDATNKQQLLSAARGVGPALLLFCSLWLLRGLAGSVRAGDPFGYPNVRRLRLLGFALVIGAPAVALVDWALRQALVNTVSPSLLGGIGVPGYAVPFAALLAGLGAFILAEVFAYGVRLREDVEATI
jgi:hypothetical protein